MKCNNCASSKIRSRSNYSHGKNSSSYTNLTCRMCGSSDIEKPKMDFKRRR